jgi:putative sterol carrier protein
MKFASILKRARSIAAEADISQVDFLAVQINIVGEENGVFYVEVKHGRISVEPYEYYDRQCAITISDTDFSKLTRGRLDPVEAYDEGKLTAEGDLGKALQFTEVLQSGIKTDESKTE